MIHEDEVVVVDGAVRIRARPAKPHAMIRPGRTLGGTAGKECFGRLVRPALLEAELVVAATCGEKKHGQDAKTARAHGEREAGTAVGARGPAAQ